MLRYFVKRVPTAHRCGATGSFALPVWSAEAPSLQHLDKDYGRRQCNQLH